MKDWFLEQLSLKMENSVFNFTVSWVSNSVTSFRELLASLARQS